MTPQPPTFDIVHDGASPRPRVSVIMLAYNNAPYIRRAILGVVRQKAPFEVQLVLSDDCSTDNTFAICQEMVGRYPDRITLLKQKRNSGIPANFMAAHSACRGEFIAMCDGDDYWCDRTKLRRMVEVMDRRPEVAIVFHRVINSYMGTGTWSLSNGGQRVDTQLADLCRGNYITNCSSLERSSACPVPPDWVGRLLLCDYAMHLLTACHGTIHYIKRPMAVYRKHPQAQWSGAAESRRLGNAIEVREQALRHIDLPDDCRNILMENLLTNLVALYAVEPTEATRERIRSWFPSLTDDALRERVAHRRSMAKRTPLKRRLLGRLRAFATFFIPLPR